VAHNATSPTVTEFIVLCCVSLLCFFDSAHCLETKGYKCRLYERTLILLAPWTQVFIRIGLSPNMHSPLLVTLRLSPRDPKGGGGSGSGSARGGSLGGAKSGSTGVGSSKSSAGSSSTSKGTTTPGNTQKASTPVVISSGQPFAGRTQGGGTRDSIYGTKCVFFFFLLRGYGALKSFIVGPTEVVIPIHQG